MLVVSTLNESHSIKKILNTYSKAIGQINNTHKLEVFFLNADWVVEDTICQILGYRKGSFPYKYLGIPLDKEIKSNKSWQHTLDKLNAKMDNWKSRWLSSMGGLLTMVKSVFLAIPSYQMSCLPLTSNVKGEMYKKIRNFYWQGISE